MAELKTKPTEFSVDDFLNKVADPAKRRDCFTVAGLMEKATGKKAKMWGPSIIGFDQYHYKYHSGHEGDMCLIGFSPRAANITLYIKAGDESQHELLTKLGKYKTGKGCLYIKKLSDVDLTVLEAMIRRGVELMRTQHKS